MYLVYLDESGDTGKVNSPSKHFFLSALVIHETAWFDFLDDLVLFRKYLKSEFGLRLKEEIHASEYISGRNPTIGGIDRNDRLLILKNCLDWLNTRKDLSIITTHIYKNVHKSDVFESAWKCLIQRIENTIQHKNFPGGFRLDSAIIICDDTNGEKLTRLIRRMRSYNPVPNMPQFGGGYRDLRLKAIVEDPNMRNSQNSYFIQMADVVCYFARQYFESNKFIRKRGARYYYSRLNNVINSYATKSSINCRIVSI